MSAMTLEDFALSQVHIICHFDLLILVSQSCLAYQKITVLCILVQQGKKIPIQNLGIHSRC